MPFKAYSIDRIREVRDQLLDPATGSLAQAARNMRAKGHHMDGSTIGTLRRDGRLKEVCVDNQWETIEKNCADWEAARRPIRTTVVVPSKKRPDRQVDQAPKARDKNRMTSITAPVPIEAIRSWKPEPALRSPTCLFPSKQHERYTPHGTPSIHALSQGTSILSLEPSLRVVSNYCIDCAKEALTPKGQKTLGHVLEQVGLAA